MASGESHVLSRFPNVILKCLSSWLLRFFGACYIRYQLESNDEEIVRFKKIILSLHFTKIFCLLVLLLQKTSIL